MRKLIKSSAKLFIKLFLLIVLPVGLIMVYGSSKKSDWSSLRPVKYKDSVKIKVGDALRAYYSLYPDEPVVVNVKGPLRLRAITRIDFDSAISRRRNYEIKVYMDGGQEPLSFKKKSEPSYLSAFREVKDKIPGKIRNIYLDIPKGKHTLIFAFETHKINRVVRMRFLTKKESGQEILARKAKKWKFFTPKEYKDKVVLYIENNKRDYFRFALKSPLKFKAKGPALVKILTRPEFTDTMGNECGYELEIYEDGKYKTNQIFETKKASKIVYAHETGFVSGIKREFLLDVPEGNHNYSIKIKKPESLLVLCRPFSKTRLPEKGGGSGEKE